MNEGHGSQSKQPNPSRRDITRKQSPTTARLSCETCSRRKVKCDRLIPCTNCHRSGTICIPVERKRLPRGRSGNMAASRRADSRENINNRIMRLEQIIHGIANTDNSSIGNVSAGTSPSEYNDTAAESTSPDGVGSVTSANRESTTRPAYFGHAAHARKQNSDCRTGSLSSTVFNKQTEELREFSGSQSYHASCDNSLDSLLTGITNAENLFSSLTSQGKPCMDLQIRQQLFHIYLIRVDPVVKILHRPSLRKYLLEGRSYLSYDIWHPAPAALASAIYYAASCTLDEEQCLSLFNMNKATLINKYKNETEAALARVDFILTNDLTVLQAFVISLIATRCHDRSRRLWTMLSLALRIAHALSLHVPDPSFPLKPFEKEMRRRLWHAIGWLDIQTSLDRASEPIMQSKWLYSQPFSNMNDNDFGFDTAVTTPLRDEVTESTLFLIFSYAQRASRLLSLSNFTESGLKDHHKRHEVILNFQQRVSKLLVGLQPDKVDFHWFLKETADFIQAFLQLLALRPSQRNAEFIPLRIPAGRILELAENAFEIRRKLYADARSQPWHWVEPFFFPWHALAVALAEICSCNDLPLIERFWPFVERGYRSFIVLVVDSPQSLLWKPMENMMKRARAIRDNLGRQQSCSNSGVSLSSCTLHPLSTPTSQGLRPPEFMPSIDNAWQTEQNNTDFRLIDPNIDLQHAIAWANYENFLENVNDSGDAMLMLY